MSESNIKTLLDDIKTVYLVGYFKDDLATEAEKWGQIQILEYVLSGENGFRTKIHPDEVLKSPISAKHIYNLEKNDHT